MAADWGLEVALVVQVRDDGNLGKGGEAGLDRTFRSETYLGGKAVLGGDEGEMSVKSRKREAQENGISKEWLAVWAAVTRSGICRLRCVCRIWSQGSTLRAVGVGADLSGLREEWGMRKWHSKKT